jgi:16S rRNA U1498 N3-methylase RsmE
MRHKRGDCVRLKDGPGRHTIYRVARISRRTGSLTIVPAGQKDAWDNRLVVHPYDVVPADETR